MKNNIINLQKFKNLQKIKMISVILIIATILSMLIWDNFFNNEIDLKKIPLSNNRTYNQQIKAVSPTEIISQIENSKGKPVLLYIYATWCNICKRQMPQLNEVARKFQNTDLKFIAIAVDKNLEGVAFQNYLQKNYQQIYFLPQYLAYNEGFQDLLLAKNIKYDKIIPFCVIINREGNVEARFEGYKSEKYIIKKLLKFY